MSELWNALIGMIHALTNILSTYAEALTVKTRIQRRGLEFVEKLQTALEPTNPIITAVIGAAANQISIIDVELAGRALAHKFAEGYHDLNSMMQEYVDRVEKEHQEYVDRVKAGRNT